MSKPSTLGQRVAMLRQEEGLTQRQLADRADVSPTFISDIENDKRNVSSAVLMQIGDALGASLDYLLRGKTKDQKRPPSRPRSIPSELEVAAQEEGWSYSDTIALLDAKQMVLARRGGRREKSKKGVEDLNREEWIRLHDSLMDN